MRDDADGRALRRVLRLGPADRALFGSGSPAWCAVPPAVFVPLAARRYARGEG